MERKTYIGLCEISKPIIDCINESIINGGYNDEKQIHLKNIRKDYLAMVIPMYIAKGWNISYISRNEQQTTADAPMTCDATIILKFCY
jgi:hypothetical protein